MPALLCLLALVTQLHAQPIDTAAVDALVRPYVRTSNFSGQVLVARGGRVVFERAYGEADRARHVANTTATRFHVASVSMQFTAAAVMRLVDAGALTLDTRVSSVVPTVRGGDAITIRQLLEMRSGLADVNARPDYPDILRRHQTPESLVAYVSGDTLLFTPGTRYVHEEHSAYNLLALVIEKRTGLPFRAALRRLVFDPLAMRHADTDDDALGDSATIARGYDPLGVDALAPTTPIHWSAKAGNASIALTASDEMRWVRALFDGPFLGASSRRAILDSTPTVGYGWFRRERFGERAYYMSGRAPGFSSYVLQLPRAGLTVVVFGNVYSSSPTEIGDGVAAIALGRPVTPLAIGAAPSSAERRALDGLAFRFGADFYQPNAPLVVTARDDALYLRWPDGSLSPLIPLGRDAFIDRAYWQRVTIERDADGRPTALAYDRFRGVFVERH